MLHIHLVENKIIRIIMSPNEINIFGKQNEIFSDSASHALLEENYNRATELVSEHLPNEGIRVPRMVHQEGDDLTVWEYINGTPLDKPWKDMLQREDVK